jgi:hypothetical protein
MGYLDLHGLDDLPQAVPNLQRGKRLNLLSSSLDASSPMRESRRQFKHIKTSRRLAVRLQVLLVKSVGYSRNSFTVKTS